MRQCGSRGNYVGAQPNAFREVRYPFGVQNDLGHVQIPTQRPRTDILGSGGRSTPVTGVSSPQFWRTSQHHRQSTSSLQSTSLQCSLASSCDVTADALMLERAIKANDTLRVKRFLHLHHDKFQVNLHGSLLGKSSSDDSQILDVEAQRKSKTVNSSPSCCSSDSSSSLSCGGIQDVPLIFNNALHLAVEYDSVDVLRLLLRYLEPNQPGRHPGGTAEPEVQHQQPSPPTTTSPTRTSLTGGGSEISPGTGPTPSASGLPVVGGSTGAMRRVSWIGGNKTEKKRRATMKVLSRQRSFSLESNSENLRPWAVERRSVSLKSSPLVSPRPPPPAVQPPRADSPKPQERSIFAELRRSSEIFKSILLNLSMKEQEVEEVGAESPSPASEPQIDVNELLAAHERMRTQEDEIYYSNGSASNSSFSESSLSSSDDDLETEVHQGHGAEIEAGSRLRINPNLPPDKATGLADIYARSYLLTLPVLFLAVVRGNPIMVYLLLKNGAAVNFQDTHGNSPLHLAVARDNVPWEAVVQLVESGGQVSLKNMRGVTPADLAPPGLLTALQHNMINKAWPEPGLEVVPQPKTTPAKILRKLRSTRAESGEEGSYASGGEQKELSSTGSARSSLNRSPDLSKEVQDVKKKDSENRKSRGRRKWRESTRERQASSVSGKRFSQFHA